MVILPYHRTKHHWKKCGMIRVAREVQHPTTPGNRAKQLVTIMLHSMAAPQLQQRHAERKDVASTSLSHPSSSQQKNRTPHRRRSPLPFTPNDVPSGQTDLNQY